MFRNKVSGYDVKIKCRELGAKHIVYGITYTDYFGQLAIQYDDIHHLSRIFYDDKSFEEWVDKTRKMFNEYGCKDLVFYAVHTD